MYCERKRVIEAEQANPDNILLLSGVFRSCVDRRILCATNNGRGYVDVNIGDWVVTNTHGEFISRDVYSDDEFHAKFIKVNDE
jgi:hypothetical protein